MRKALTGTALLLSLLGTTAMAQSSGVPREFPPEDFAGNQFVDSEGCAFIRAGISGNTSWVPRVDASRRQLCNFQPTFAAPGPESIAAPDGDAVAEATAPSATEAAAQTASAEEPAAEDLPLIIFPSEAEVAASNRPVTVPVPSRTPTAPSPRVIAAAPEPAPIPSPAPMVEPTAPPLTSAEVCEGKFGPQPGFVSSRTGETLDCGPAPVIANAPVQATAAGPEPLRMTMAEICEAASVGDRKFVDANTGNPIICPAEIEVARASVPASQPDAQTAPIVASACPEIPAAPGQNVRCGPQVKRPWTAAGSDGASSRAKSPIAGLARAQVPASNPAPSAAAAQPQVPAGYEQVWNDGRLNSRRGLPATATAASVQAAQVSTRQVPTQSALPYKYIQVGSFGVPSNAENLLARLQSMGLGTAAGNSGSLRIVAVGPFTNAADMQRALSTVRSMGFPDAFPRN